MTNPYYQACDDEYAELQAAAAEAKHYQRELAEHPSCDDPAHPGCKECREDLE